MNREDRHMNHKNLENYKNREVTGRIHSIETLGALDGPGLRTVVFLQGCPMRCIYCHNPDTWDANAGRLVPVSYVMEKIKKQRNYYNDRGGITISGGEPLLQGVFTREFLKKCREAGVNTVLDTSGCGFHYSVGREAKGTDVMLDNVVEMPSGAGEKSDAAGSLPEDVEAVSYDKSAFLGEIILLCDLIILDVKHADPEKFKEITGKGMEEFLEFIELCRKKAAPLWIRQVVVPGLNDHEEDMLKLKDLISGLNVRKIELLPYHTHGVHKWERLGIDYKLKDVQPASEESVKKLMSMLKN